MTGLRLWANGEPTEWGIEVFTEGECWTLAYYLHKIGGWPVYLMYHKELDRACWEHVVVKIGRNKYLDVNGVQTKDQLHKGWGLKLHKLQRKFETWNEFHDEVGGCHNYERPHERSRTMAKRLVETYVQTA